MRPRWSNAAALFLGLASIAVPCWADSIIINGDPPVDFTIVTTDSFTFGANSQGGGDFGFTNETGHVWTQLDILFTLPTFQSITCGSVSFVTCTVNILSGVTETPVRYDVVFGPNPIGGITNTQNFTVNLNDNGIVNTEPNGSGSWPASEDFGAVANAPEPGTWVLAALGILFLLAYCLRALAFGSKRFSKAAN